MLRRLLPLLLPLFAFATSLPVHAAYPDKPIRLIVGYPPGGATDTMARLIGKQLSVRLHESVIVENHPGAGGTIATSLVAHARPDGYTLLLASSASFSIAPFIFKQLPYKDSDFSPIGLIARVPQVLEVNPSLPVHNLQQFIAYAKAHQGKLSYASFGNGSSNHLVGELFKRVADVDIVHVPYTGSASAITDMLGGQTQLMFDTVQSSLPYIQSHRVTPIAISTPKRSPLLPAVPTFDELGLHGLDVRPWFGVSAPAGLPADTYAKLVAAMRASQADPEFSHEIEAMGAEPSNDAGPVFQTFIDSQRQEWGTVAKLSGATMR
jgi:tripartite-type tricarboxylate transporter receptor subunit TctC